MTITEYAIIPFHSPPDFSDPTLGPLFDKLSAWQSECSGFQLRFYASAKEPREVYLVTRWTSVAAHEAWIRGERNQELLHLFAPYVDMQRVRMAHVDVDFEAMQRDTGYPDDAIIVERYDGACWVERSFEKASFEGCAREFIGRDLAKDDGDVFRFAGVAEDGEVDAVSGSVAPVERWVLKRVEL